MRRVDHDRFFKELLTTFFRDFLMLFFRKLASRIEPQSIEFLPQEVFGNLARGRKLETDILARVKVAGKETCFLIHVEHQSTVDAGFPERLYQYSAALSLKYGLPVYPIAVFSHDKPRSAQPDKYRMTFPDGLAQIFRYRVVQLNRMAWRKFLRTKNPVATALMVKMNVAEQDRPRVKLECLRLMLTLRLDEARMQLIGTFVDAYLRLSAGEVREFERQLARSPLKRKEKQKMLDYVTSWEQKGIRKGRAEGRQEGRQEGIETLRAVLRDVATQAITERFGAVPPGLAERIENLDSQEELRTFISRALSASKLADLEN
ncbi:MAG: flagellar assembly protein H [Acidobacteria bacterium]|nr:flagellar assembly protein H [Acidobacteriota bacterium]